MFSVEETWKRSFPRGIESERKKAQMEKSFASKVCHLKWKENLGVESSN
jgi:hypothetical protein